MRAEAERLGPDYLAGELYIADVKLESVARELRCLLRVRKPSKAALRRLLAYIEGR
jgi:hypothetical protein